MTKLVLRIGTKILELNSDINIFRLCSIKMLFSKEASDPIIIPFGCSLVFSGKDNHQIVKLKYFCNSMILFLANIKIS